MNISSNLIVTYFLVVATLGCQSKADHKTSKFIAPTKAENKKEGDKYQLLVNGDPFFIKGAGLEFGNIAKLAEHGGNSFRTWRTNNGQRSGEEVLDEAYKHGLYVTMGLDIERERHGFDYNDKASVAVQFERIKAEVMELKNHPALIIWAIGNELNLRATNPKVWDAVNDISKMIHEVDPNHLTTTTLAGIGKDLVIDIKERAFDLDLLSIQMYGDIVNLPKYIVETGWDGPYMVTEWGATGHWEVGTTKWEAPIENTSTAKAKAYLDRYKIAIESQANQCVGSYVFLWGQKQERTPTWYGIFMKDGNETESVDVMHYIWNNAWPANRTPQLLEFKLDDKEATENIYLKAGHSYDASVAINDSDGDPIKYVWDIMRESTDLGDGGDFESTPESLSALVKGKEAKAKVTAPDETGAYRLFIYAYDGQEHTAHANIPFYVN
jgi:hypothetical protein